MSTVNAAVDGGLIGLGVAAVFLFVREVAFRYGYDVAHVFSCCLAAVQISVGIGTLIGISDPTWTTQQALRHGVTAGAATFVVALIGALQGRTASQKRKGAP